MDVDHPDIMDFIECKWHEEQKAKALIAAGISPEEAYHTVFFQNTNHSIRVTDKFMRQVADPKDHVGWTIVNRGDGNKTVYGGYAPKILRRTAEIAWETGDPGIQFHDRMNIDNPVPSLGEIIATNPCSEFSAVDNSSCNLASLNLVKYWDGELFDFLTFTDDIKVLITAMDILVEAADYPTPEIREMTVKTRPLGLGFTNLGALLMLKGLSYDSPEAREFAALIAKRMTVSAYACSAKLAGQLGSFEAFKDNKDTCIDIAMRLTEGGLDDTPAIVRENIKHWGLRNSQLTLLAPTGTISFMMDCDTTGIEPLFALKSMKTLAGGGQITLIPACAKEKLTELQGKGPIQDASNAGMTLDIALDDLDTDQKAIFKTANEIHWKDHILMMAACQKHLNGAISKTINMPADCTVEDIEEAYKMAWQEELKSIAIYRDGCKDIQPLQAVVEEPEEEDDDEPGWSPMRRKLPSTRQSLTHEFNIAGFEGYFTVGLYEDGEPGELFINMQKQGSTISGLMDSFAILFSFALQYGVPLTKLVSKFKGTNFIPAGITDNEDIPIAKSIMDYIFRWFEMMFLDDEEEDDGPISIAPAPQKVIDASGPPCVECGSITIRAGACYLCPNCGATTGCS
jgi:ribonucleoside-diphosphate reductase alpha chain